MPFYPDDTIEDLQRSGLRLLQKKHGFRFGTDSVLLAAYAASFCTAGCARQDRGLPIWVLAAAQSACCWRPACPWPQLVGLELDPASCGTLERNSRLNQLTGRLQAIQGDIRDLAVWQAGPTSSLQPHSFDLVVSNPPYRLSRPYPAGDRAACSPAGSRRWKKRS